MSDRIDTAIARNDLDELIRIVGDADVARDWDTLLVAREKARRAFDDTGRQLWPAASRAEYLLALRAPGIVAAEVLVADAGFFALGPLAEVAASTHTWAEIAPHLAPGPIAAMFAHERVVRGEDLSHERVLSADVLEVPLALEAWEPEYFFATYHDDRVEEDAPGAWNGRSLEPTSAVAVEDPDADVVDALSDLVPAWRSAETASVRVVEVDGTAADAVFALGHTQARGARLAPEEGLAWCEIGRASCRERV